MKTEPNQALEPTTTAVTDRAPSSTLRASCGRSSSLTFGNEISVIETVLDYRESPNI